MNLYLYVYVFRYMFELPTLEMFLICSFFTNFIFAVLKKFVLMKKCIISLTVKYCNG